MSEDAEPLPEKLPDTRSRIVLAGMRLFRKHGFHGVGISDILTLAQAPKGSLYHHFPLGKQAIGVAVIEQLAQGMLAMMQGSHASTCQALVADLGAQLAGTMERTNHELCSLFSGFVAERRANPALGDAVANAYNMLAAHLAQRLLADGHSELAAADTALTVVMLLEGGATLAQAQQSAAPFKVAVLQACKLCRKAPDEVSAKSALS